MQLHSKMRFISAQFSAFLYNDLWLHNAGQANGMARYLEKQINDIPQLELTRAVETNGLFVTLPPHIIEQLKEEYFFYMWDAAQNEARWMTAFDTTEEDIDRFCAVIRRLV
ncbi:MAG: hypothetical protein GF313_09775 [Caldithrix sp.]|nr:hypothetical protein [Caldithrix sp.]